MLNRRTVIQASLGGGLVAVLPVLAAFFASGRLVRARTQTAAALRKSSAELRKQFEALGLDPANEIIPYCQGGYRAAHAYLALKIAGYPRVRNYLGSWAEWGNRDDLPREHPRRK